MEEMELEKWQIPDTCKSGRRSRTGWLAVAKGWPDRQKVWEQVKHSGIITTQSLKNKTNSYFVFFVGRGRDVPMSEERSANEVHMGSQSDGSLCLAMGVWDSHNSVYPVI